MPIQNKTQKQTNEEKAQTKKRTSQKKKAALLIEKRTAELSEEFRANANEKTDDVYWQVVSEESYVKTKIKEEFSSRPAVPRGVYQEVDWTERNHKFKFLTALKTASPHIFEELRSITKVFKNLFGEIACELNEQGQSEQMGICLKKISELEDQIYRRITDQFFTRMLPDYVINASYPGWKRVKLPLRLCKVIICSQDKISEFDLPQNQELKQWFSSHSDEYDIRTFNSLFQDLRKIITQKLQVGEVNSDAVFNDYLTLQVFLFDWMEKHHLEKYWLLGVAYSILCQFAGNETLPVENIELFLPQVYRKLQADKFTFEMEGWWAGKISAKEYEKQVLAKLKKSLPEYFHKAYKDLDLADKKQVTKPKDPTYKGIYFLLAWNEGATNPQIAECFAEFYKRNPLGDDIKDATNALTAFTLPKRVDKPGRKSSFTVSDERLNFIKKVLIENLEKEIVANPQNSKSIKRTLIEVKKRYGVKT